jgi:hypothetical protein
MFERDQLQLLHLSYIDDGLLINFNASQKVCFSAVVSCENQEEGLIGKNYNVKMFSSREAVRGVVTTLSHFKMKLTLVFYVFYIIFTQYRFVCLSEMETCEGKRKRYRMEILPLDTDYKL